MESKADLIGSQLMAAKFEGKMQEFIEKEKEFFGKTSFSSQEDELKFYE